jgi:lipoprotein-anchoring transpeptidase ErfK/SrfK
MNTTRTATRFLQALLTMTIAASSAANASAATANPADDNPAPVTRRIVVSIPDRKLALLENDQIVSLYPVAVGAAASPSPVGTFTIVSRVSNPTYYRPGKIIEPGSANPVGTRWIGLSEKGYGIHGTDDPRSIGFAKSHGCIRLRNQDVEKLFERVRAGDVVELHAELTPEIAQLFASAK